MGSQYESDQEGDPLDQFEEYIEMEGSSDKDADVVYIRAARVMDRQDMEDILFDDTNANSDSETSTMVEAKTSTLIEEEETSVVDIPAIPNGMAPLELLMSLDKDTHLTIYCR